MLSNAAAERIQESEEAKELRRKSESIKAAKDAQAENQYVIFEGQRTGIRGIYRGNSQGSVDGLLFSCEANKRLLISWCDRRDLDITVDNLNRAFDELNETGTLAPCNIDPTKNTAADRVNQNGNARNLFPDPSPRPRAVTQALVLPYTKHELKIMSENDYPRWRRIYDKFGSKAIQAIMDREE